MDAFLEATTSAPARGHIARFFTDGITVGDFIFIHRARRSAAPTIWRGSIHDWPASGRDTFATNSPVDDHDKARRFELMVLSAGVGSPIVEISC